MDKRTGKSVIGSLVCGGAIMLIMTIFSVAINPVYWETLWLPYIFFLTLGSLMIAIAFGIDRKYNIEFGKK